MDRRNFLRKGTMVAGLGTSRALWQPLARNEYGEPELRSANVQVGARSPAAGSGVLLFRDDFSKFPACLLSSPVNQLNGAIQEVHYLSNRGVPLGPWTNAIVHMDAWVVSDEDGRPYLEQHLVNALPKLMSPILLTGDSAWSDYTVEVRVRPLSLADLAGVVFRYHTNRHYCLFALTGGHTARLAVRRPIETAFRIADWRELAVCEFAYDTQHYYTLRVENEGPLIRAWVDGKKLLEVGDSELTAGKVGVSANIPARFQDFVVTCPGEVKTQIDSRIERRERELASLRSENPQPQLWKKFATPRFGAGRSVRFGDLDGDSQIEMLIGQNIPRVHEDDFDQISRLTAVKLDGRILWQSGRPDPRNGLLTNDLPFQIHDIDGDGRGEVVLIEDFKLKILEGSTGKVRRWAWMPMAPPAPEHPYEAVSGDCIAFFNLSGDPGRRELLIKDRYSHFWILNHRFEVLWQGQGQTGHFPYPFPSDPGGLDKVVIGYSLWDASGHRLWSQDSKLRDHADAIIMGNFSGDAAARPRAYACGSDEGFIVFDDHGEILKHVWIGHAQNLGVGKFRPDLPGLQCMTINFWNNPGIITLFDADGNILVQEEPAHAGSPLLPVNWRGDGQVFALLSGNRREGGMLDGQLRRVVTFPDDGHPDLCCAVADVTGDARDEVILWDQERVWTYTQDRPFTGERIYAPLRNPLYNESNYRAVLAWPHWKEPRGENAARQCRW